MSRRCSVALSRCPSSFAAGGESDAGPQPRGGDLTGLGRAPHGAEPHNTGENVKT